MKKLSIIGCLFPFCICAQNHDYIWWFEYTHRMFLEFNTSPPMLSIQPANTRASVNVTCFSDSTGNELLFYTHGTSVRNRLGNIMENGDSINYGPYWETVYPYGSNNAVGPFALPMPGYNDRYVLIHTGVEVEVVNSIFEDIQSPLYFSIIDMNRNDGLGKVIYKGQILLEGDIIWTAACKHGNGRDWWVVTAQQGNPNLLIYLLDPMGFHGPFLHYENISFSRTELVSHSAFSPDGRTYVRHDGRNGLRIYDFDRCTGTFSNLRWMQYDTLNPVFFTWSVAFSADSRFMFVSKPSVVWQIDLAADSLRMDTIAVWNGKDCSESYYFGKIAMMQTGPDGKIYASPGQSSSKCLTMIHQPDLPGSSADIAYGGYPLPQINNGSLALYPHYRLGTWVGSVCDTLSGERPSGFYETSGPPPVARSAGDYRVFKVPAPPPNPNPDPEDLQVPMDILLRRYTDPSNQPIKH